MLGTVSRNAHAGKHLQHQLTPLLVACCPSVMCFAELLLLVRQCGSQLPEPDVQALGLRFSGGRPGMLDAGALLQSARAAAGVGR